MPPRKKQAAKNSESTIEPEKKEIESLPIQTKPAPSNEKPSIPQSQLVQEPKKEINSQILSSIPTKNPQINQSLEPEKKIIISSTNEKKSIEGQNLIQENKENNVEKLKSSKSSNNGDGHLLKLNQFNKFDATIKHDITEDEKKKLREQRFANNADLNQKDNQKLLERAKRFNLINTDEEELKKQKRAERFKQESTLDSETQKKIERAKKFGLIVPELEEEKKKLRAEKFGSQLGNPIKKIKKF